MHNSSYINISKRIKQNIFIFIKLNMYKAKTDAYIPYCIEPYDI